jgi:hypothetical protein
MTDNKFFTKTCFKQALTCETSLFYYSHKNEYINNETTNDFLKSLADGGYQVEFLARDYFPKGINLKHLSLDENIRQTQKLIKSNKDVILFEPTFLIDDFLIRADIIEKIGNTIRILEIKAKGFDFEKDNKPMFFINSKTLKSGNIQLKKDWAPYVLDVAFQKYVISMIYPNLSIEGHLFMLNKDAQTSINGLHQKYLVKPDYEIEIVPGSVGSPIMETVCLDEVFDTINLFGEDYHFFYGQSFIGFIDTVKKSYLSDIKIKPCISSKCKSCVFYTTEETDKMKSGFLECWSEYTEKPKEEFIDNPSILDLWNFRKKDELLSERIYTIKDITSLNIFEDTKFKENEDGGMSVKDRQLIQVKKILIDDDSIFVHKKELKNVMDNFIYPLNMIDFETISTAIPFNVHLKPYESLAYQFSHHIINQDGSIIHANQYLHTKQGEFPSFEFARKLKEALETNNGFIFMYSHHENSILNCIINQLHSPLGQLEKDKDELISFLKTITKSNSSTLNKLSDIEPWKGNRCLIDLLDILKKYYYNPLSGKGGGSNSIKYILPAILKSSDFLKNKYSKPIYGTDLIPSYNFKEKVWLEYDEIGNIINPYKQLPPLFNDIKNQDEFITNDFLCDGGSAMIAYAKMQFSIMSDEERKSVENGLLRYCELDTLSMVMLYEHFKEIIEY